MFYRFRQSLYRFMYGRYGNDLLGNFLFIVYFILIISNLFIINLTNLYLLSNIIQIISLLLAFYIIFRTFSRNIVSRSKENQKFLRIRNNITGFFKGRHRRFKERKTHIYKKCPCCKATLRLPRKKGKHTSCCPKCNNSFKVKVR